MTDEEISNKAKGYWARTKAWADKNRTISGAMAGFAAGTVVPGLGNVVGAIVGAGVGFVSAKEKESREQAKRDLSLTIRPDNNRDVS